MTPPITAYSSPGTASRKSISYGILQRHGPACMSCGVRLSFPPVATDDSRPVAVFIASAQGRVPGLQALCPSCATRYRVKRFKKGVYKFPKKADLKRELFDETGGRCAYCGCDLRRCWSVGGEKHPDDATIEHVLPRSRGGHSYRDNLVIACRDCNETKLHLTLPEYRILLALVHHAAGDEAPATINHQQEGTPMTCRNNAPQKPR